MHQLSDLPIHPTKRHPLTGEPLQAIYRSKSGRVFWPVMGGAPEGDGGGSGGQNGGQGGAGGGQGGSGGSGDQSGGQGGSGGTGGGQGQAGNVPAGYAVDAQGRSLGYPSAKTVSDMTDKEQAAYWMHHAQKHEGRYKNLTGDRSFDQTKADLEAFEKMKREQQTPAEQALTDKFNEGKAAARAELNPQAAKAVFRVALAAQGLEGSELNDLVQFTDASQFVSDNGEIDTEKVIGFAQRFGPGKGGSTGRQRDFGGGRREEHAPQSGAQGKAQLERRGYGPKTA